MSDTNATVLSEILAQQKEEQAPDMAADEFFEFFTAQQILRDYQLDPEEIKSGIVGQATLGNSTGTDGGIDAMYLLVNGRIIRDLDQAQDLKHLKQNVTFDLIFVQSTLQTGFQFNRVVRLKDTVENIFRMESEPDEFPEKYSEELFDCIKRFREVHRALLMKRPIFHVSFYYATQGDTNTVAKDIQRKAEALKMEIPASLATVTKCSFSFLGASQLIALFRQPPKSAFTLNCVSSIKVGAGYVALVDLAEYRALITSASGELLEYLFESNVRDYEGDVDVNKQIRATLQRQDDTVDFWWLNNGVTIIAQEIGGHQTKLAIHEPQVVNGLQTSKEIFEHFTAGTVKRHTVVKLIEAPDAEQQDRIIKATNSQTKIPPQYLWATDKCQRDIEQVFSSSGMHYDRRKNSWRKKSFSLDKVVGMSELAQTLGAIFMQEPDHARARPSRFFKNEHYKKIFATQLPMELYVICAKLRKKAEAFLKTAVPKGQERNNLLFYVLMAVVCLETKSLRPKVNSIIGNKVKEIDDTALRTALALVKPIYEKHGASDKAAKGPEMVTELKASLLSKFAKKKAAK